MAPIADGAVVPNGSIPDVTVDEDTIINVPNITVNDPDEGPNNLHLSGHSDNQAIISDVTGL